MQLFASSQAADSYLAIPLTIYWESMRTRISATLVLLSMLLCFAAHLPAQKSEKTGRRVISTVKPAYPQTLKNLHIEGLVRLRVTVFANGTVSNIEVIGGNPILVENAVKAVKNWKFVVAPSQTEEEVVLNFFDR